VSRRREIQPDTFFVLRTPLLPCEELHALSAGLEAPAFLSDTAGLEAALARDRRRLRERLRAQLERPEVREALFLASPSLEQSLPSWYADPEGERGQKVERTLVRYLARMAARPTPFGLFAGCTLGTVGEQTRLTLGPRRGYQRHTRLDGDYLGALCEGLLRAPGLAGSLRYSPNSSLYRAAGRLHYAEARLQDGARSYHLIAVEESPYLLATLARAAGGALPGDLARALCTEEPGMAGEIDLADAEGFITELIASQILVPALAPAVTGPEPIHPLIAQLAPIAPAQAAALARARDGLQALDQAGLGVAPQRYRDIAADLEALPAPVELSRLFQVDLIKPGPEITLGREVLAEITDGVELLRRLAPPVRPGALSQFIEDFQQRYGDQEVPLCQALDEEAGIGFAASRAPGAEAAPLLRGIAFSGGEEEGPPMGRRDRALLGLLSQALAAGAQEIALSPEDVESLANPEPPRLPDSFAVMATVLGQGAGWRVHLHSASGPSGANLLGRFCHGDEALAGHVRRHLRAEEALRPEAIFAEVVHLPEGRIGNVLLRPLLRDHEIPYLGRSGAPPERHLPLTDLRVSVVAGRVRLRSARLGREVIPRLTTAHNFTSPHNLGVYRFLCAVQGQGTARSLGFDWGALDGAPYLPRVVRGRLVLAAARWQLGAAQLRPLRAARGAALYRAAQTLRAALRLPRFVGLADGDNVLPLDLDNALSIESGARLLREREQATLTEIFIAPEDLCAAGPEGRFVHELVVPCTAAPDAARAGASGGPARAAGLPQGEAAPAAPVARRFVPGSAWLYAKIYTGTAGADQVLREVVRPLVAGALEAGAAEEWFFLRYGDPEWHLRLRLRGDPRRLLAEVLPALHAALGPLLDDGTVFRCQLDTYDREVERYGGPLGVRLAERLFCADSEAALALIEACAGDEGADARWRLCLLGMDRLLDDLGLDLPGKRQVLQDARASFGREFHVDPTLERQLGERYRKERLALEALLASPVQAQGAAHPLAEGPSILRRRSAALAGVAAELRGAKPRGAWPCRCGPWPGATSTCTPTGCSGPPPGRRSWCSMISCAGSMSPRRPGATGARARSAVDLAAGPEEEPLERVEVGARVVELREQRLAVARDEAVIEGRGQAPLVLGEEAALDPLDDLVAAGQVVAVDAQLDALLPEAQAVEDRGVLPGGQHLARRPRRRALGQGLAEGGLGGDLGGDPVRGVISMRRHLDRELAALGERVGKAAQELGVAGQPVQRGVGEEQVVVARRAQVGDVLAAEAEAVAGEGPAAGQHGLGAVDADGLLRLQVAVQVAGQLTGAAAEIGDAHARGLLDQLEQVEEGLGSLCLEALVLLWVPGTMAGLGLRGGLHDERV
jgi:thiopeptide-type bacteriocin biosynthesis protein